MSINDLEKQVNITDVHDCVFDEMRLGILGIFFETVFRSAAR